MWYLKFKVLIKVLVEQCDRLLRNNLVNPGCIRWCIICDPEGVEWVYVRRYLHLTGVLVCDWLEWEWLLLPATRLYFWCYFEDGSPHCMHQQMHKKSHPCLTSCVINVGLVCTRRSTWQRWTSSTSHWAKATPSIRPCARKITSSKISSKIWTPGRTKLQKGSPKSSKRS